MFRIKSIIHNKTVLNGGLFSIFSFFNQGISFVLLLLLANYIAPDDYGRLSMFNTVVMFVGYFIALSSQGYLPVSFFKDPTNFKKDVSSIFAIMALMGGIISILILVAGSYLSSVFELDVKFIWFALVVAFFHVFINMILDYYRVQENILKYGVISCGFALFNFVLSLYLVIHLGQGWAGRINAQLFCTIGFGIIALGVFIYRGIYSFNVDIHNIKKIALWGIPLIPHLATIWIKQGGDRLIINNSYSLSEVGIFSFALTMMSAVVMIGMAFNSSISVNVFKNLSSISDKTAVKQKLVKLEKLSGLIYFGSLVAIIIVANIFIPLLLPQYASSLPYFNILSLSGFLQCLYFHYSNVFFYFGKTKSIMFITFATSIIHLLLSLLFTKYSLLYTCLIYVVSQFLVTFLAKLMGNNILNNCVK